VKLLLDTHAFIWLDGDPSRLPPRVRAACTDPTNELYLSLASIWEIQIKSQLGRLTLRGELFSILNGQQQTNNLRLLPIELADILGLAALPMHHRDPFDRLIVSQAQRGALELVTHDPEIAKYPVTILWD
jgi:PIN domain nuclease of toxin-antitoxin system